MIRAVLFDWDGTLVDTGDLLLSCWHRMSERVLGYTFPVTEEDRKFYLSMRATESFPKLTDDPDKLRRLFEEFDSAYLELAPGRVRELPGAAALIRSLRDRGVKVAVVTSKTTQRTRIDMLATGLDGMFDLVITGDDVTHGKPDPEGTLRAMAELGSEPASTVFVGDMAVDIRAGQAAGTWTVGLTHGIGGTDAFAQIDPDYVFADLAGLSNAFDDNLIGRDGRRART